MSTTARLLTALLLVFAAACSPSAEQQLDQMRQDLLDAGMSPSTVDCMDGVMREGETLDDFIAAGMGGEVSEDFVQRSQEFMRCVPADEVPALLSLSEPEAMRNGFITGVVESGNGQIDREQAGCVFDEIVASDVTIEEFVAESLTATETGQFSPEVQTVLEGSMATCGIG